ncbi:hypothetical protein BS78_06G056700 [Paspalum vaginatum]|nr:hypothetical protein BS78_06G056700 [Paspalum vaginatum]
MALAAAARRSLASRLSGRLHPVHPHLLTSHCSGADVTPSPPLHPASALFRLPHFSLPQSPGTTAQTLTLFPFGVHLAGAGASSRGFSSLPSYRAADAGAVLTYAADAAAAPAISASSPSEVAWIAEDSSLAVAAVQHLIDAVHSFTGLNWWLSIAVSTVLLRSAAFTITFSARKQLAVDDEKSEQEANERILSLIKRLGPPMAFMVIVSSYTFMSLYFAISNMAETLPSLKEGGAFWFTDLTTPDALYIFPAITALSLMIKFEFIRQYSRTERSLETDVLRILYCLTFPFAASFPQAMCCYFVTWSLASLTQVIVLKQPSVRKLLLRKPNNPTSPSAEGPTGSNGDDSPHPVSDHEQPLPPERREASDSSIVQAKDQSDKKSEKDS